MPNASAHQMFAAFTVGGANFVSDFWEGKQSSKSWASLVLSGLFGTLPDSLEPAIHPHHRQFCHSVTFGVIVWCLGRKVYNWRPESEMDEMARFVLLVAGGAYLSHLVLDSLTKRSLPLVGKLHA